MSITFLTFKLASEFHIIKPVTLHKNTDTWPFLFPVMMNALDVNVHSKSVMFTGDAHFLYLRFLLNWLRPANSRSIVIFQVENEKQQTFSHYYIKVLIKYLYRPLCKLAT